MHANGYASKHEMAFDLAHIEIHFKTLGQDIQHNYVAPYELVDNDQDLLFTPYMFKDALNEWCHDRLDTFVEITIADLWGRLRVFRESVNVPPYIVSKLENMIKYIEKHEKEYVGISVVT